MILDSTVPCLVFFFLPNVEYAFSPYLDRTCFISSDFSYFVLLAVLRKFPSFRFMAAGWMAGLSCCGAFFFFFTCRGYSLGNYGIAGPEVRGALGRWRYVDVSVFLFCFFSEDRVVSMEG